MICGQYTGVPDELDLVLVSQIRLSAFNISYIKGVPTCFDDWLTRSDFGPTDVCNIQLVCLVVHLVSVPNKVPEPLDIAQLFWLETHCFLSKLNQARRMTSNEAVSSVRLWLI